MLQGDIEAMMQAPPGRRAPRRRGVWQAVGRDARYRARVNGVRMTAVLETTITSTPANRMGICAALRSGLLSR